MQKDFKLLLDFISSVRSELHTLEVFLPPDFICSCTEALEGLKMYLHIDSGHYIYIENTLTIISMLKSLPINSGNRALLSMNLNTLYTVIAGTGLLSEILLNKIIEINSYKKL